MLMTVQEFREKVENSLTSLIQRLQVITGRSGAEEAQAWRTSLPKLSNALSTPALSPLHLYFSGAGELTVEYQLPAASSWCDVVLLGRGAARPCAVVIELKDWETRGDEPGPYEGLMRHHGALVLHPSDQVRGYVEYCRRFHSAVQDIGADVVGCVLFTRDYFAARYEEDPNAELATEYPCFTTSPAVTQDGLADYLTRHVTNPDSDFANAFIKGTYKQDRGFIRQIGEQILSPEGSPFVLLDNQRRAFAVVRGLLETRVLATKHPEKQVIIVEGPPGSGKSVLAANVWASLVTDERLPDGSVVLTTTSTCQTSNWTHLFKQGGGHRSAGGVVKKAGGYVPLTTQQVGTLRKRHGSKFLADAEIWRDNVKLLRNMGVTFRDGSRDDQYLVSIVDEAHALINPEHVEGRGQYGFTSTLGPLAWHIIRSSTISIFLLDSEQGFRDRENTSVEDVEQWAGELGASVNDRISLADAQFRCGGSTEFVEWFEGLLRGDAPEVLRPLADVWKQALDFKLVDTPVALEDALRHRIDERYSARLLASYARPWKTKKANEPHDLPPDLCDFNEQYTENGRRRTWKKIWNYVPQNGSDYTWFIQAPANTPMGADPLCEVGCPYAVRGFDFDYVGILWLGDLINRAGSWEIAVEHVHESGLQRSVREARKQGPGRDAWYSLRERVMQAYRILLTRGIRGVYIWFEDAETRRYVERSIMQDS